MMTQQQYELLHKELNEQQWRLYLGTEALKIGYGGISQASGTPSSNLKTLPHSRTKPRHMVYTGVHLRLSHQASERRLLLQSPPSVERAAPTPPAACPPPGNARVT